MSSVTSVLAVAAALVAVAGCSSSSDDYSTVPVSGPGNVTPTNSRTGTGGCVAQYAPVICTTVEISGSTAVAGTATVVAPVGPGDDPNVTCAQLATESDGGSRELGDNLVQVGAGHASVLWDASFAHFAGPASYSTGDLQFSVTVGKVTFEPAANGAVSVTVGPDFATTMTFTKLDSTEVDGNTISGSISWTCRDLG